MNIHRAAAQHSIPGRPRRSARAKPGRSDRAADRRRHAQLDRGRDRIRHRAHRALADDPRGARLPRRPVRPLLPQAHRPLLFGDAERGGARLSAGDDAAGRRVPDERHLSHRRLHRPPARPLQHGAGVPRRRGGRLHPGVRPSRRHRRPRAGLDAGHRRHGVRGRPRDPADQALRREGVRNDAAFTIIKRNTRVPEMLAADLDSEIQACVMGARRMEELFERFGTRDGRGLLPGDPRQVPRHLPQRAAAEDRRRRVRLGGLRRARRRHRPEAAQARAEDDQAGRAHHARLHRHRSAIDRPDQLAGRLRRRRVPDQMDRADPAQPRRHAGARRRDPRQRRRVRGVRRGVPAEGHADHAGMAGGDQCALVRAAALPRPARRRGRAGGRRPHAGRPGDHPLHRLLRQRRSTASRSCRAKCSAAAPAAATTPTATTRSTSCRTRATSRPSSPRRAFRCWSRSSRCAPIPAAPASAAAGSATTSTIARWSIAAPSSPPTACGSAATASTAARPGSRSASRSMPAAPRATSAAWSTASRCWPGRSCAW